MENVILRGRYKIEDNKISFFNTGSGIFLKAKGNSLKIHVRMLSSSGYIAIIRNKNYEKKEKIFVENNKIISLSLNSNSFEFIDIIKVNEATKNTLVIEKIECDGILEKIDQSKEKLVKVYGDSSIAGFGILSHDGEENVHNSDGVEDFCFRALYSLGVDYDIFCASGWGLTFSEYTDPKTVGIEKFKDNLCVNSREKWCGKKCDLLIISLGTNDNAFIEANPLTKDEKIQKFILRYKKIIEDERKVNKDLPVIMIYGSLKEENVYYLIEKTYKELSKILSKICLVKLDGDNSAISNHSYVKYHKKMAQNLAIKIKEILQ